MALNECLQLLYHQSCRHHLILLYPREILVLDLEINQTVGIIQMERSGSPYVQVHMVLPIMPFHTCFILMFRRDKTNDKMNSKAKNPHCQNSFKI